MIGYHSWVSWTSNEDKADGSGRQILEVQTSIGLLNTASTSGYSNLPADEFGRDYFNHQATDGIEILNHGGKQFILSIKQISNVARQYGLQSVVRWQPKDVSLHSCYQQN